MTPTRNPGKAPALCCAPLFTPHSARYTLLRPDTLIRWHQRYVRNYLWLLSRRGVGARRGRPRIPETIVQIILHIKADNPRYGHKQEICHDDKD